ncbi:MAG: metal ABC transporter permease [Candidatus Dasytiphilus stammeri]
MINLLFPGWLAGIISMLDVTIGMFISGYYDTPVGPSIVVTATLIFFLV